MKRTDVFQTIKEGECVTSIYAQTYLPHDHCDYKRPIPEISEQDVKKSSLEENDEWVSPSDLLIGILNLKPPFTSKITRGTTHRGILKIGDGILEREHAKFLSFMTKKIKENDASWNYILEYEKAETAKKVKAMYHDILTKKSKTLMKEINIFYEKSLQELEDHLRSEVQTMLLSAHTSIISDLNFEIKENLNKERVILEGVLQKKYDSEVKKITHYYKLLLDNEHYRNSRLINRAIYERNDAIKAFYKQIEAQNITSTMYIMSTERKKCRIRKFILENMQNNEIAENLKKIKERQDIIDAFKAREKQIHEINKEWEEKIKKILQLFLKFVSFSLKLLPEQTTFLLDLEKMVVLQLNEIQKTPLKTTSILVDQDDQNIFRFTDPESEETICDKEPFVVEGDPTEIPPPVYGSRETLPPDVDLPYMKTQGKYIYAKCGRMEEVRAFLKSQRCTCDDTPLPSPASSSKSSESTVTPIIETPAEVKSDSSFEPLLMDNIKIFEDCPVRRCKDWANINSFPWLVGYLDFTEEKYEYVKTILGKLPKQPPFPDLIDPVSMFTQEFPFSATKEPCHTVGTQYSSREDVSIDFKCPCMGVEPKYPTYMESEPKVKVSESREIQDIVLKREESLRRVLNEHPKLLKMFTDENFDFVYKIKI